MGKWRRMPNRNVLIENPRMVHFGLTVGSSDLIGLLPIKITQEMVGQTVAVFAAVETKTLTGEAKEKQNHFIDFINQNGGIGIIARSPEDLRNAFSG